MVRLEDELRTLIQTWRALRVDCTTASDQRAKMERQAAQEVLETQEALFLLRRSMGGLVPNLSDQDRQDVANILSTIGRDGG